MTAGQRIGVHVARPTGGATADLTIDYARAGAGAPVLLVHGNFASRQWWLEQLTDPAPGLDLIAPDLPGFVRSDPLPGAWPTSEWVDAWADTMAEFLKALGVEQAGVVGHSLGGAVAQTLAVRHPELVTALLLVDAAPPAGFVTPEAHFPVLSAYRTNRELLTAGLSAITPTRQPAYFPALIDDAMGMDEHNYQGNARALGEYDLSGRTTAVTVPVTVLHGGKDLLVPAAAAVATADAYPNATLITWEDVGHSPPLEAPAAFRDLLATTFSGGAK